MLKVIHFHIYKPILVFYLSIMKEQFELIENFNVSPEIIYKAWLNSAQHTSMTGGEAECSDAEGGVFSAWDGYIEGKNELLVPNQKIKQTWRTSEFAASDPDSILVIELKAIVNGTELTLRHSNIPQGQTGYKKGWVEHYFNPMKSYFGE